MRRAFRNIFFFLAAAGAPAAAQDLAPAAPGLEDNLFVWTDTCNAYVLRDGDAALLFDLGDGGLLEHLDRIGVKRIEWVLFTHHHREQCQGVPKLREWRPRIAAPEAERALFERPTDFRKMRPSLGDKFTVYGASYVRPPVEPIPLDRGLKPMETFPWHGREILCLETKGHSPGGMSYLLRAGDRWIALSGDVMLDGARMHYWPDSEWDYGFGAGIYPLAAGAGLLEHWDPILLLPSHGPPVSAPARQLRQYIEKLRRFERLYLRGYGVNTFGAADQDPVSRPTPVPGLGRISRHLYKLRGPNQWANFGLILADSGRALAVDAGLDRKTLERVIEGMTEHLGLKGIDAVLVTHMHGDHILDAPALREKHGTRIWTLKGIEDKFEHPERFDFAALVNAYGAGLDSVRIDRTFEPGEKLLWEGFTLTVDWLPGQTKHGCGLWGQIDGRRVIFTGDNIFGYPEDPSQTGHEAVVAHNDAVLEEGYMVCADFLRRLQPDLMLGGHSWVMDRPAGLIERFWTWSRAMREAYRELSAEEDYRIMFDPYGVRAEPYRVTARPGGTAEVVLHVRNFKDRPQRHRISLRAPDGIAADPPVLEGTIEAGKTGTYPLRLLPPPGIKEGLRIVALDVTLDGKRYGERFDLILYVGP